MGRCWKNAEKLVWAYFMGYAYELSFRFRFWVHI